MSFATCRTCIGSSTNATKCRRPQLPRLARLLGFAFMGYRARCELADSLRQLRPPLLHPVLESEGMRRPVRVGFYRQGRQTAPVARRTRLGSRAKTTPQTEATPPVLAGHVRSNVDQGTTP